MSDGRGQLSATDAWIGDLYRRHSNWLTRRLRRRFGEEADDVAHEAWRRLISAYAHAGMIRHPRALLLRIAVNSGLDHRKRSGRAKCLNGDEAGEESAVQAQSQETAVLLEQIILGLPEGLRDVFVMSRFGGLSNAQIAERLGISPKTVEWRMTKALAHCAAQLR